TAYGVRPPCLAQSRLQGRARSFTTAKRGVFVAAGQVAAPPRVSVLELEEAKGLLETGQAAGSLTSEEISAVLDELELDAGQLEDFYQALDELQIEIVDGEAAEAEEEAESDEVSTDALQLFLKDVGKVDLLTA